METVLKKQFEIGRVYRFRYGGETRVVLLQEFQEGRYTENILCWDFTKDGYRSFNKNAIYDTIQDVTKYATISNKVDYVYENSSVRSHVFNNKLYAVKF